jgi:hypothetical protein
VRETLQEKVTVNLVSNCKTGQVLPKHLGWRGRSYTISKTGLHHTYRSGRALIHVFSVTDGNTFFRLELNTDTLLWTLTEVSDGQPG